MYHQKKRGLSPATSLLIFLPVRFRPDTFYSPHPSTSPSVHLSKRSSPGNSSEETE